jgi:hypothetical protein
LFTAFELAAVDRNNGTGEEFEPTAKPDELTTHRLDRRAIVPAEVGNRLEVRGKPPDQPHQLDIALRFSLEPPARLNAVEIAVEVDLQQRRGMVGWPPRRRRRHPRKPQGGKVQLVDEDLDHPNRVLLADIIFQAVREQRPLHPIFAIDEPMHRQAPEAPSFGILAQRYPSRNPTAPQSQARFHTAWPINRNAA